MADIVEETVDILVLLLVLVLVAILIYAGFQFQGFFKDLFGGPSAIAKNAKQVAQDTVNAVKGQDSADVAVGTENYWQQEQTLDQADEAKGVNPADDPNQVAASVPSWPSLSNLFSNLSNVLPWNWDNNDTLAPPSQGQ